MPIFITTISKGHNNGWSWLLYLRSKPLFVFLSTGFHKDQKNASVKETQNKVLWQKWLHRRIERERKHKSAKNPCRWLLKFTIERIFDWPNLQLIKFRTDRSYNWSNLQFIRITIDQIYNWSNSGLTEVTIDQICNWPNLQLTKFTIHQIYNWPNLQLTIFTIDQTYNRPNLQLIKFTIDQIYNS